MINVKDLNVSFGNKCVLKDVNLKIDEGDFIIITGESGCGKTTLLNCITMLEKYKSGSIEYNNISYSKLNNRSKIKILKNDFGIIFQDFGLIDELSVYKNLEFVNKNKSKIKEILDEFKLNIDLNTKVSLLSGGEKQRLALARIVLKKAKIIFADEPTGNLDEDNSKIVMDHLLKMNQKGTTIIVVTHDKSLLKYANKEFKM